MGCVLPENVVKPEYCCYLTVIPSYPADPVVHGRGQHLDPVCSTSGPQYAVRVLVLVLYLESSICLLYTVQCYIATLLNTTL